METFAVIRVLVLLSAFSLPFTKALTLDLAFPVKIYEVALLIAGMLALCRLRVPVSPRASVEVWILAAFIGTVFLISIFRFVVPAEGLNSTGFTMRFGPIGDGLAKLLYLTFVGVVFALFSAYTFRDQRAVLTAWLAGAVLAAAYAWYLFLASFVGLDALLLPGIDAPQHMTIGARSFIRSGTFEEGNFMGLYLIVSTALAVYARRLVTATFLALSTIISFSTATVIGLFVFCALYVGRHLARRETAMRALGGTLAGLLVVAAVIVSKDAPFVREVVIEKLVGDSVSSRDDRLDQTVTGLRMFGDHPLVGVGLARYGYHYHHYQHSGLFDQPQQRKVIANNVYVEVLSEAGVTGFGIFLLFLGAICRRARGRALEPLRYGLYATLVMFLAHPSYIIAFLWAFFAVIVGASARQACGDARIGMQAVAPLR